jgi:hypothetical protein
MEIASMRVCRQIRLRVELIATERGIDQAEINAALASGQRLNQLCTQA